MPRDLFGSGTRPTALTRAFSRYTVLGSLALHLVIIAVVLIVPLFADDVLPRVDMGRVQFVNQAFVQPPSVPPAASATPKVQPAVNHDAAPVVPPSRIIEEQQIPPVNAVIGSISDVTSVSGPVDVGAIGDTKGIAPPGPPPVVTPRQAPLGPQRVGGAIRQPVRTNYVAPVYPEIARVARVQGAVQIEAVIGTDGVVQQARVISGSPLLSDAALSAVRQWRYTPTTLNNQPISVIMTVTVTFTLQS
jgi:protein TonB